MISVSFVNFNINCLIWVGFWLNVIQVKDHFLDISAGKDLAYHISGSEIESYLYQIITLCEIESWIEKKNYRYT